MDVARLLFFRIHPDRKQIINVSYIILKKCDLSCSYLFLKISILSNVKHKLTYCLNVYSRLNDYTGSRCIKGNNIA